MLKHDTQAPSNLIALVDIQKRILGLILAGKVSPATASMMVAEAKYFAPPLDRIATSIISAAERDLETTPTVVGTQMEGDPGLAEIGGTDFLNKLALDTSATIAIRDDLGQFGRAIDTHRTLRLRVELLDDLSDGYEALARGEPDAIEKIAHLSARAAAAAPDVKVLNAAKFVRGFAAPDYVVDGILQRGFLYSMTGPTGGGKTAVALRLAAHIATGQPLGTRPVQAGKVLVLIGENADDVRARWIALVEQMSAPAELEVYFLPRIIHLRKSLPFLRAEAQRIGPLSLLVVDTSAAYFHGNDENSNVESGDHARTLRALTELAGRPCVLVNCHPTKSASGDNLQPRGGGAFIAEVDGNLTCSKSASAVMLHWSGKFRGPNFDPVAFELVTTKSQRLLDSHGRHVPTVVARPLSSDKQILKGVRTDTERSELLRALVDHRGASLSALAKALGWMTRDGKPYRVKVSRLLIELGVDNLAIKVENRWTVTEAGKRAAKLAPK